MKLFQIESDIYYFVSFLLCGMLHTPQNDKHGNEIRSGLYFYELVIMIMTKGRENYINLYITDICRGSDRNIFLYFLHKGFVPNGKKNKK